MKFIRSLPLMWASTRWPFSSSTANMVFGSGSMTVPSTSIASLLATGCVLPFLTRSAGPGGPTHERVAYQKSQPGKPRVRPRANRAGSPWTSVRCGRITLRLPIQTAVRTSGPCSVMAMVSSKWAASEPSTVDDGPVVGEDVGAVVAEREHRLDGQAQARLELAAAATGAVVGDLRLLVHLGADAVAHELADDAEAVRLGDVLDRGRDVLDVVAGHGGGDAGLHRLRGSCR